MKSSIYNSKIFKIFDYVARLVLLNLLILIPSFLIVVFFNFIFKDPTSILSLLVVIPLLMYFYPACCAAVNVIRRYELNFTKLVFKEFFKSFHRIYKKAFLETILITILFLLFYNSITYFSLHIKEGILYQASFVLSIGFASVAVAIVIHMMLVMNYMQGFSIIQDFQLALMMAFKDLTITIALIITFIFVAYLDIYYDTFLIIIGVSGPLYLLVKLTLKKYYIVYTKTKNKREE